MRYSQVKHMIIGILLQQRVLKLYTDKYYSHFVNRGQLFDDLKNGKLPNVSWVIPSNPISEHPPANIKLGILVLVCFDSIMKSPYWNTTAIIVTWDDYGRLLQIM